MPAAVVCLAHADGLAETVHVEASERAAPHTCRLDPPAVRAAVPLLDAVTHSASRRRACSRRHTFARSPVCTKSQPQQRTVVVSGYSVSCPPHRGHLTFKIRLGSVVIFGSLSEIFRGSTRRPRTPPPARRLAGPPRGYLFCPRLATTKRAGASGQAPRSMQREA